MVGRVLWYMRWLVAPIPSVASIQINSNASVSWMSTHKVNSSVFVFWYVLMSFVYSVVTLAKMYFEGVRFVI